MCVCLYFYLFALKLDMFQLPEAAHGLDSLQIVEKGQFAQSTDARPSVGLQEIQALTSHGLVSFHG